MIDIRRAQKFRDDYSEFRAQFERLRLHANNEVFVWLTTTVFAYLLPSVTLQIELSYFNPLLVFQ